MGPQLTQLLGVASPGFLSPAGVPEASPVYPAEPLKTEYLEVLRQKNGFFAFEQALHFLPLGASREYMDVERWNSPDLWRRDYGDLADGLTFFAEDVFGGQFAFRGGKIYRFDPETGDAEQFSSSLEQWARKILKEDEVETGHPLAHEWQVQHGLLPVGSRLVPKLPFVLGGEYETQNLVSKDAVEGMKIRACIAVQIHDLPDGASIQFEIEE